MIRAFIAVNLSESQRREVGRLIDDFRRHDVRVKWVNAANLHVTMKFLGDTSEDSLTEMFSAVGDALTGLKQFNLKLANVGCFPSAKKPKVIWVGINDGFGHLKEVSKRVEAAVEPFGFAPEQRKFSAHVTVGRVKDNKNIQLLTGEFVNVRFESSSAMIGDVVFYKSDLRPEGPIYTPLRTFELGK